MNTLNDMSYIELMELLGATLLGGFMSYVIIPRISLISFRKRLFDSVDPRKVHHGYVPRLGGVAFFPSILIAVFLVIAFRNELFGTNLLDFERTNRLLVIVCCLFILYLTGMMDDLIGVRYRSKFLIQILCGCFLALVDLRIDNLYGLFGVYELPLWVSFPLTVFVVVYVLNAINLIDGIDGLASGLSMMALLFMGYVFVRLDAFLYALIAFVSLGVLVPFFYYNVFGQVARGRKIFMGDTGSLTMGMILVTLAIRLSVYDPVKEAMFPSSAIRAFSFLIVPLFDVVRVVIHRVRTGHHPFLPDKNHIHHKFIALGYSHRKAMLIILAISLGFSLLNMVGIHYVAITPLLGIDILLWTSLHLWITSRINGRRSVENKKRQQ